MKDIRMRLLYALMTDCKRSDRELSKALSVSQPTVTRARSWLEQNNLVQEYTAIPNFSKIRLELVAMTFIRLHIENSSDKYDQIRSKATSFLESHPNVVMCLRGEGMNSDGIIVSLHRDFADFTNFMRELKMQTVNTEVTGNFLASLKDTNQYRDLTFKYLAGYLDKTENQSADNAR